MTSTGTSDGGPATRPLSPLRGERHSLTDQVAAAIRAAARSGELEPGRLYSAYVLADQLGVSRSPVREALLRLAEVGLVRFERNRGFRVLLPRAQDIAEVFAIRLALEVPAARRAAAAGPARLAADLTAELDAMRRAAAAVDDVGLMRHDQQLHGLLLTAAGNARAAAIVDNLRDVTRLIGASTLDGSRSREDVCAEHEPILAAVAAGDPDSAAAAMAEHLERTGRLLVAQALDRPGAAGGSARAADADEVWRAAVG